MGWKYGDQRRGGKTDVIQGRVCEKVLRIPRFAVIRVAKPGLQRDSRGKVMCLAVKYLLRILQLGKEELVGVYEW
jgi:hypothetical protein